jgi:hypothetical protein
MTRIAYLSTARFSGDESGAFLQSQLTADIAALQDGSATFACYCTPKGQVLGLLRVQRSGDDYLVAGDSRLLPGILQRLKMFVFRTRVEFGPATDLAVFGSPGPDYRFAPCNDGEAETDPAWKADELRAGVTWLGPGSSERFIPQMLGFDELDAVSFSKGCYPGQEIVARARYLGSVKRKPLVLEVNGAVEPEPGAKLRVQRGEEWHDAVVVDSAPAGAGRTVVFTVARAEPDLPAQALEFGGETYGCATI